MFLNSQFENAMSLSDAWLKSNNGKPREKIEVVTDRDSLSVRISPKGKIVFQYRYRFNAQSKRIDIGTYPLISLKDARAQALSYKAFLDQGQDPQREKMNKDASYRDQLTVKEISTEWFTKVAKDKVAQPVDLRAFEIHVFPKMGKRICDDVTLQEWSNLLFEIAEDAETVAVKVLGNLRLIMRWGCVHGKLKNQPLQNLKVADLNISKNVGTRKLSEQEIYWVIHSSQNSRFTAAKNKALLLMLLFFGCRVSELRLAKKSDFDFDKMIWTIPPENHKMGKKKNRSIVRPIIEEIVPFLKYVFSLTPDDCEYALATSYAKRYDPVQKGFQTTIPYYIDKNIKLNYGVDIESWSTHDLRRTMRTQISALAPPHICEIMLGHALPQIWGTYDLHEYLDPQAQAYKKWFNKLCAILDNHALFDTSGDKSKASSIPFFSSHVATALTP